MIHIRNRGFVPNEEKREGKKENKKLVTFKLQPVIDFIGSSILDSLFTKKNSPSEWFEITKLSMEGTASWYTHTHSHAITHTVERKETNIYLMIHSSKFDAVQNVTSFSRPQMKKCCRKWKKENGVRQGDEENGSTSQLNYPSSFGGVNHPFFSWIWTSDLKDCWARARLYWPLVALNWMRALPLTRVAAICKIKASIV